jgi:hypothetical protein
VSIQAFELFSVGSDVTQALLTSAASAHNKPEWHLSTFSGFPTAMLLRPDRTYPGSLHYMFFPARACQEFHYHPGERYLVLIGDVDMHVHNSGVGQREDPTETPETLVVPANTLVAVRFPAYFWHSFETKSDFGLGVLALTFHNDDEIDALSPVADDLMEDRTIYWQRGRP